MEPLTMGALAVGGGLLSGLGSWFGSKGKTKTSFIDPYNNIAFGNELRGTIMDRVNNQSAYGGQYAAPMTADEQAAIDRQNRLAAMGEGWASHYQPGQINPEVDATEWQNLNRKFYGDGLDPGAKALAEEQFAGPGGYWGSARAKGVMDTYGRTVTDPYQQFRSGALQSSYNNALNYQTGQSATNLQAGQMSSLPRQIQQYGLDKQYTEWVRGREEMATYMKGALDFLSVTKPAIQQETKTSPWAHVLSGVGSGLSTAAMMGAMTPAPSVGGGGGTIGNSPFTEAARPRISYS